jgi:hypothetical protein
MAGRTEAAALEFGHGYSVVVGVGGDFDLLELVMGSGV